MKKCLLIFAMLLFLVSSMAVANASNSPPGDLQISLTEVLSDFEVLPEVSVMPMAEVPEFTLLTEGGSFIGPGILFSPMTKYMLANIIYDKTFATRHYTEIGYSIWN